MSEKPTYEELEHRIRELEKAEAERKKLEEDLRQSKKELREIKRILEDRVESMLSPEKSLADLEVTDLVGIETLKELNEVFADAFDICLLLTDANGKYITGPSNLCEPCQVVRRTEKGLERCKANDTLLAKKAQVSAHPIITRCSNIGFIDAVVPIHIGERHVASWLVGQFCPPEVDEKRVRQCALKIGADVQELLAAYDKMKSRPVEELENALELLAVIARRLSEYGLNNLTLAREITSRKQTEKALKASEERYRILVETITDVVFIIAPNGSLTYLNPEFENITGYPVQDFIGRPFTEILAPEYIESTVDRFKRGLSGETIPIYEVELKHKDGKMVPLELKVTSLLDDAGNAIDRTGVARDITKRKQAEEALRESGEKYRSLVESTEDSIYLVDRNCAYLFMNKKHLSRFGRPVGKVVGREYGDFHSAEETKEFIKRVKEVFETGKSISYEYRSKRDGGYFLRTLSPVKKPDGKITTVTVISKNITARKQTEDALRRSQKMLARTESITHIGSWEWEIATDTVTWSEELFRIFQLDSDDREPSWAEHPKLYHPEDFETLRQAVKDAVTNGTPYEMELRAFRKDGETRVCQARGFAEFGENGKPVRLFGSLHDITERKRMEEELLKAQKLESVGLLAGGIAHDFNNILTIIMGNVSLAKTDLAQGDDPSELLTEAERASKRAQTLTRQLLTFAKGGAPLKETASIRDILKASSSFVMRGSKSDCKFSLADDLWVAEVDVGQINQVINNIVINANQAMTEGGTIQVAAENVIIEDRHGLPINPGRYIKISIKDQGMGIAKDHLSKLFDPYFTTKQEGSGLGLATTYSIIQKHDGHITVESQLGIGTTFHIYLPASDKAIPEKEEVKLIKGQGRILIMDDEAPLQKMIGRMLKNLGYESEFATNGAEAIHMVKDAKEAETPYDAAILDLTIPGKMGGKDAIKKLLEIDPELKAIVFSGYSDDPVMANFKEYGFKGMIPKPFESRLLGKVLHEVLKGEKKE